MKWMTVKIQEMRGKIGNILLWVTFIIHEAKLCYLKVYLYQLSMYIENSRVTTNEGWGSKSPHQTGGGGGWKQEESCTDDGGGNNEHHYNLLFSIQPYFFKFFQEKRPRRILEKLSPRCVKHIIKAGRVGQCRVMLWW